ncbi:mCG147009 [Mus musculus]|nr:mCG147009 [Mus musculus]
MLSLSRKSCIVFTCSPTAGCLSCLFLIFCLLVGESHGTMNVGAQVSFETLLLLLAVHPEWDWHVCF